MRPATIDFPPRLPVRASVQSIESVPYHWHDALEIVLVLRGSVLVQLGDEQVRLQEHDLAVVNMGELHRFLEGTLDNQVLVIQADPGFCHRLLTPDRYLFLWCCSAYHGDDRERYRQLRQRIARLVVALAGHARQSVKSVLTDLLRYLFYEFDFLRRGIGETPLDEKRVERLQQMAVQASRDLENSPGLKDMASIASVSVQYLSNDIKEKFGRTFQELLFYSKCEQAAKLLLCTKQRIVDISLECGFSDPKYLIKHFKRYFRSNPSQFRRQHQAGPEELWSQVKISPCSFCAALEHFRLQGLL